jgi:hypothetical protein
MKPRRRPRSRKGQSDLVQQKIVRRQRSYLALKSPDLPANQGVQKSWYDAALQQLALQRGSGRRIPACLRARYQRAHDHPSLMVLSLLTGACSGRRIGAYAVRLAADV